VTRLKFEQSHRNSQRDRTLDMKHSKLFYFVIGYCVLVSTLLLIFLDKSSLFDTISKFELKKVETCGRFPSAEYVTIDNLYWQVLQTPNGFVNIYNAYLDLRQNKSVVRINVDAICLNESRKFYCQFWKDEVSAPTVVKATEKLLAWREMLTSRW
jgi:hypothetical protein